MGSAWLLPLCFSMLQCAVRGCNPKFLTSGDVDFIVQMMLSTSRPRPFDQVPATLCFFFEIRDENLRVSELSEQQAEARALTSELLFPTGGDTLCGTSPTPVRHTFLFCKTTMLVYLFAAYLAQACCDSSASHMHIFGDVHFRILLAEFSVGACWGPESHLLQGHFTRMTC